MNPCHHDEAPHRRDVPCSGGAALFGTPMAPLLGAAKPARGGAIAGAVWEVDRVAVRVLRPKSAVVVTALLAGLLVVLTPGRPAQSQVCGAPCANNNECYNPILQYGDPACSYCNQGVCQQGLPRGSACVVDTDCYQLNPDIDASLCTEGFCGGPPPSPSPTIEAEVLELPLGGSVDDADVARVSASSVEYLEVTATPGVSGSGVLLSDIWLESDGSVTADVEVECTATTSSFTLTLVDTAQEQSLASDVLTVRVLTPDDQFPALRDDVRALVRDGELSRGLANSLEAKLDAAFERYLDGGFRAATNILRAFEREVRALVAHGKLASAQGEALIRAAQALGQSLACQGV